MTQHIVITGAGGFIGQRLATSLLADPAFSNCRFSLVDVNNSASRPADPRVTSHSGDIADRAFLARIMSDDVTGVVHLAAVLGGAAEMNPGLARRVNIDATLDLLELASCASCPVRFVYASSIAVFGSMSGEPINDDTPPRPLMFYGAHKRMIEIAVEQLSARGLIDGIALRLPGIVARRDADERLKSAFLNRLFHDFQSGHAITLPVSSDGTSWLISVPACIDALKRALLLPPAMLGARRAFTLPALRVRMKDLVQALERLWPSSQTQVTYLPDADIEAQFARQPALTTPEADRLGFHHDGTLESLIKRAVE